MDNIIQYPLYQDPNYRPQLKEMGCEIQLRLDGTELKPHETTSGTVYATDLRWFLSGGYLDPRQTALKLMGPHGEVNNAFPRIRI